MPRSSADPRKAKMMAEKALRRGTVDVQGAVGQRHVRHGPAGPGRASRLFEDAECQEPDAGDEVSLRHRPHLFGQGRALQPGHDEGAGGLRRHARSQARQQARHHRHPAPVRHGGRGARLGRLGARFRAGQGAADRLPQGGRAHLSVQRGVRPGAQDRRDRLRHHVEGARRAVAERRHQGRDRGAQGRRADVRLGLRDAEERAQQGSGLRLARRHDGAVGAGELRHRHGLQPDRHQRQRAGRRRRSASASPTRRRSAWSTSTTPTWPRTTSPIQDWWNKSFKG